MLDRMGPDSRRTTPVVRQVIAPSSGVASSTANTSVASSDAPEAPAPQLRVRHAGSSARVADTQRVAAPSRAPRPPDPDGKTGGREHSASKVTSLDILAMRDPERRPYLELLDRAGKTRLGKLALLGKGEMRTLTTAPLWSPDGLYGMGSFGLRPAGIVVSSVTSGVVLLFLSKDRRHLTLWHAEADLDDLVETARTCRRTLERRSGQLCVTMLFTNNAVRRRMLEAGQLADFENDRYRVAENFSDPGEATKFVERAMQRRAKAISACARALDTDSGPTLVGDLPWGVIVVEQGAGFHSFGDARQPPSFKIDWGPRS